MWREKVLLPANAGPPLLAAFEAGQLAEFIAATPKGSDVQTACHLILEYAEPRDGFLVNYPVYASIEALPQPGSVRVLQKMRRTLLRQVKLEVAEVLTLRPLFPRLTQRLAENTPNSAICRRSFPRFRVPRFQPPNWHKSPRCRSVFARRCERGGIHSG